MPQCRVKVTAQLSHGNEEQPSQRNGKLLRNTTYIKKLHSITRFNTRSSLAALLPTIFPEEGKDGAPQLIQWPSLLVHACCLLLSYLITLETTDSTPCHHTWHGLSLTPAGWSVCLPGHTHGLWQRWCRNTCGSFFIAQNITVLPYSVQQVFPYSPHWNHEYNQMF